MNTAFNSYIKDIFIEVPNYKYNHKPFSSDASRNESHIFIGREKLKSNFLHILKNGSKNGAYLVTGYRGMGKTSLVNNVVSTYAKERKEDEVKPIKISLAQSKLEETDVLRYILKILHENIREERLKYYMPFIDYRSLLFAIFSFFTGLIILYNFKLGFEINDLKDYLKESLSFWGIVFIVLCIVSFVLIYTLAKYLLEALNTFVNEYGKLEFQLLSIITIGFALEIHQMGFLYTNIFIFIFVSYIVFMIFLLMIFYINNYKKYIKYIIYSKN
ncbi:ATP-binding protein [Salmonirosea aquatica]|uniref:Uncharacterized protein n=1 Tax=Salmonirosea aquatica TaxID=2654236 RepID=A0A7C9G079_9BACT|nr:hypothetical protein [Cytophagaceae bacterium SJW1-29]